MQYEMTNGEKRKSRKIIKRIIIQSHWHQRNIIDLLKILVEESKNQFREDNDSTTKDLLMECMEIATDETLEHVSPQMKRWSNNRPLDAINLSTSTCAMADSGG